MKQVLQYLGTICLGILVAVIIAIITHRCGGSDFLCGAFSIVGARAIVDYINS